MPSYKFPRPAVTVDIVVFGVTLMEDKPSLDVLLIRRGGPPFKNCLALPGGFVNLPESLEHAALRELREETGIIAQPYLEQLYTFGEPKRDPRERVISVAYYALVASRDHIIKAGSDAKEVGWYDVRAFYSPDETNVVGAVTIKRTRPGHYKIKLAPAEPMRLAFDHQQILAKAIRRLQDKIRYAPIGFDLLPVAFTFSQLQKLYEIILLRPIDKANFQRKWKALGILVPCGKTTGPGKSAALYFFDKKSYSAAIARGINFEI
jgi:8-oxo-dGTP diphosphatase